MQKPPGKGKRTAKEGMERAEMRSVPAVPMPKRLLLLRFPKACAPSRREEATGKSCPGDKPQRNAATRRGAKAAPAVR